MSKEKTMRVLTLVSVLAGLMLIGQTAQAKDLRIGVVDLQRAVNETDEGKKEEANLKSRKDKLEGELNRKLKEFYDEEEKLRKSWSILKEADRQKKAQESRQKFEGLQKRYLEAERELMEAKTKAMMKITEKLNKIIKTIAEKDKYDYIFNNAAVLWAPRPTDMTNEVIRLYNSAKK